MGFWERLRRYTSWLSGQSVQSFGVGNAAAIPDELRICHGQGSLRQGSLLVRYSVAVVLRIT